jgi:hypothetical protein
VSLNSPIQDYPSVRELLYGAMRASIEAAAVLSHNGTWCGDSNWGDDGHYLVNDHQGEYGMIRFRADGQCVGALHSGDPWRRSDIEAILAKVPSDLVRSLRSIVESPFLDSFRPPIGTAIFWSDRGQIVSTEEWETFYRYGAHAIRNELMPDSLWYDEAAENFDFTRRVPEVIASLARRRIDAGGPVILTAEEATVLLPAGSPGRDEALETLRTGGLWSMVSR